MIICGKGMIINARVLAPAEAEERCKMQVDNQAFTQGVIDDIMSFDTSSGVVWNTSVSEVVKMQEILNLYKAYFKLSTNKELFEHIKAQPYMTNDINYMILQDLLVETYRILTGRVELGHKNWRKQAMRDREIDILSRILRNKNIQTIVPETSVQSVNGIGLILEKRSVSKSNLGKCKNMALREMILKEARKPEFFEGCDNKQYIKILRLLRAASECARVLGRENGNISERTARRYLKMIEDNKV